MNVWLMQSCFVIHEPLIRFVASDQIGERVTYEKINKTKLERFKFLSEISELSKLSWNNPELKNLERSSELNMK